MGSSEPARRPCVVHVDSERGFSGGEVQVFLLAAGLERRGWRNVLVCRERSAAAEEARARGIEVRPASMRSDLDLPAIASIRTAIRATGADLVHLHTGRATWLGGIAAWLARVPAITTRRMDHPIARGWRTRFVYERLMSHVVAISPAVAARLRGGEVPASRITVIPSAVEAGALSPGRPRDRVRAELDTTHDAEVLLTLAALVPRKGVDVLLRALRILAADDLRPVLWIAGDGAERPTLEALSESLGLAAQVRFLGRRSDRPDLLGACDLVVAPSRSEGLGVAALEAMAVGRPVVASAVGGLGEAVVHGRTGLLVPPDDPGALAEALGQVLRDRALRAALGGEGPRRVAEAFAAEQMVESYVRLYGSVLEGWKRRAERA